MITDTNYAIPVDIWGEIVKYSKSSFTSLIYVDIKISQFVKDYIKNNPIKKHFDKAMWKNYGGDSGCEPPIPIKIYTRFDHSKHLLTLIPKTLNGEILTLTSIDEFVMNYKNRAFSNYKHRLSECGICNKTVDQYESHLSNAIERYFTRN